MTRFASWALAAVALLIAVFTLIPAQVWSPAQIDQQYQGFDRNLVYATGGGGGSADVTSTRVTLTSRPHATPAATLITTPLQRVAATLTVEVLQEQYAIQPLQVGFWSPLDGAGFVVKFGAAPSNPISIESISGAAPASSLTGGSVVRESTIGTYSLDQPYQISFLVDRAHGRVSAQVYTQGSELGQDAVDKRTFPQLFVPVRLSLTASSAGGSNGSSESVLTGYSLTLLHEQFWTSKVADAKAQIMLIALGVAAAILVVFAAITQSGALVLWLTTTGRAAATASRGVIRQPVHLAIGLAALVVYIAGNALLFQFSGHPFDMGGAKVFAYVAHAYGPTQLYYLPNLVPLAQVWRGVPQLEAGDPYGPLSTYLFAGIGWFDHLLFGSPTSNAGGMQMEVLIKSVNALFGLADAGLVYVLLGRTGVGHLWQLIGTALVLFNPAVWFNMSVWGQTHMISVFFVLAAILFAESRRVTLSWLGLVAACLTRPQMLVFAGLVGVVLLRKFDWRHNLVGISWSVVLTYLFMLPLTITTSPSLPVDLILNNFRVQEAGGNDPTVTTVSQGAYSIWPLVTLFTGHSSFSRIGAESQATLVGPLSYQHTGQILTAIVLLSIVIFLATRKREWLEHGGYIPAVALGISAFLMLLTGIVSTHVLLALPFLVLCRRWLDPGAYLFVVGAWTVTAFVTMYGDMGTILTLSSPGTSLLSSAAKPITESAIKLYSWDRFITAGVIVNICAILWLAFFAFRPRLPQSRVAEPA